MNKLAFASLILCSITILAGCNMDQRIEYPVTRKVDHVDDYFGTRVADPYRWLEDDRSDESAEWVEAQNAVTFKYLEKIPYREALKRRLTEIQNYPRYSAPLRVGEHYIFSKNDGLQNQAVIYVQKGLDGEAEVLIDPNELSADGTIRIGLAGVSGDRKYIAVTKGEAGSDWSEINIMELASKKILPDRILWTKFSAAAWYRDGFFYSGYDEPARGGELTARNQFQKIFYHKMGDPQEKDTLIYEDARNPLRYFSLEVSEDEKYAFLGISEGTSGNELYWKDLTRAEAPFEPLIEGFEFDSYPVDNVGRKFLIYTNVDAPNYKVVLIDPDKPSKNNWNTVIGEKPEVLSSAGTGAGKLFCFYLKDARTQIYQHELDGTPVREIELPALGTASGLSGWKDDTVLFYTFTSYTSPPTIYKYDPVKGESEIFRRSAVRFNPGDFDVKQVFYESRDSTRIPMFIVHRKGIALDGSNPCYLTAYGGFNNSIVPAFDPLNIALFENGVVFAQPNLRGGGEYGEKWHKAGMLDKKQNVFDDFIAAAEYLIRENYTAPEKLAIRGGSNGGLLVGAVMNQRPDLFKVALPAVGVMDMLRFHKFTVGWGWVVEYGSSDNEEGFRNLYAYSPLHNIREGVDYPATLVTTADHDDRVVPAHSFKYIATLQEKYKGRNPVLIRIETRSGHGSSNVTKDIEETADVFSFFFHNVGMNVQY
ncbi:MAG: S9 family peptidase [Acidobacteria bacterium]|nr:S9 family peptidase [Acidobacteriota bacterium]